MLACADEDALPLETWYRLADELKAAAAPNQAMVTIWGGEPLLYEHFADLAKYLFEAGIQVQVVTNGTLIDTQATALCRYLDKIHISVDGTETVHDAVRNPGVYSKIRRNLPLIKDRRGQLVFLTTVSDANVKGISQLPHKLIEELHPDGIVLQPLMYLSRREIDEYREYFRGHFGCDYPELESWHREDAEEYRKVLAEELEKVSKENYAVPVKFTPHGDNPAIHCQRPWYFVHVRHDGEVGFCTDYFGFTAGNVKTQSLVEIFNSDRANAYRAAVESNALNTCRHCPWRLQEEM